MKKRRAEERKEKGIPDPPWHCSDCGTEVSRHGKKCQICSRKVATEKIRKIQNDPATHEERSRRTKQSWTAKRREQWGKRQREQWAIPEVRARRLKALKKAVQKDEYKEKMRGITTRRYDDPEEREKTAEHTRQMWRDGVFDGVFQSPTSIEIEVAAALDELGIAHVGQYRPDGYSRPFDEFIEPNILIEVNGDYWHGNPLRFPIVKQDHRQTLTRKRDKTKAAWAKKHGYNLCVIWENEIKSAGARALIEERVVPLVPYGFEYTSRGGEHV